MARLRSCRVSLSHKERKIIRHLLKKAASSNARVRYAILLAADENKRKHVPTNSEIASASGASIPTVIDTLKKYCQDGTAAAVKPARDPDSDTARLKATGDAEAKIILVMDNLNTHSIASLYEAFPPEEAHRIAKKLEVHYTPKHGMIAMIKTRLL